jgi:serine/threonine protein kinase
MRAAYLNSSIGEYRLVDFIGEGGMGEVYRAVHGTIGRVVAVKVLTHAAQSTGFIERFRNEARIQASLHHPNIAALYDFQEIHGRPCIIMEYVDGHVLMDRIAGWGALQVNEALYVLRAIAEAMEYVHNQGVVHRDIKSNNIKISSTGEVKLLDFGIAKGNASPSLTMTGDVIGTLQYLSPEQIKGGVADSRSDIWAMGVLLYEMVTARLPFDSTTLGDLFNKISKASYPTPTTLNPSLPREVEAIVSRCLRKNPADRYQNAGALVRDINQILTIAPASRSSDRSESSPPISQRKKSTGKLAAAASLIIGVLALGIYFVIPSDPEPPSPPANKNAATPAKPQRPVKSVQIESVEGPAEVYLNGQRVGTTPYKLNAPVGERVRLVLKREGFNDRQEEFDVTERNVYTFSMNKKE